MAFAALRGLASSATRSSTNSRKAARSCRPRSRPPCARCPGIWPYHASLNDAYSTYNAVITQEDEHGNHASSVSAPQIQAMQLEQADIRPGDNVLETGTNGPPALV